MASDYELNFSDFLNRRLRYGEPLLAFEGKRVETQLFEPVLLVLFCWLLVMYMLMHDSEEFCTCFAFHGFPKFLRWRSGAHDAFRLFLRSRVKASSGHRLDYFGS